ncbi:mitochondrial transcription termination factor family protein [Actinidia rufa]|uniref:Mitochondrial transcription termination factor family protein n=1 Tax=Actinidia rufa TaxID=165716 RepID=A0A7J0HFS2_9ERIC|nr:mitochondrial transcription termination factor family protein [Actinidia rufa]
MDSLKPRSPISLEFGPGYLCVIRRKLFCPNSNFSSKGVSSTDVTKIVSTSPVLLQRNLEKIVVLSFDLFSNLLQSEEKTLAAIKSYEALLLFDHQTHLTLNIEILREIGVPNVHIMFLLTKHPRAFMTGSHRFGQIVKEVETMGQPFENKFCGSSACIEDND